MLLLLSRSHLCLLHPVFDDGDERTLKRSSLVLKGGRHYHESEVSVHAYILTVLHLICLLILTHLCVSCDADGSGSISHLPRVTRSS